MSLTSDFIYVDKNKEVERAVEYLSTCNRVGYDTETTGLQIIGGVSKLLLIQIGTEEVVYVFDARKINTQLLKPIIESKSILKVAHNCLLGDMRVLLPDGRRVRIDKLVREKYSGEVWSVNERTNGLEKRKVVGWVDKEPRDHSDWLRIRVRGKGCLRLTKEHEVLTDRGRVRAENIIIGDRIKTILPALSEQQLSLIYGSCLGDASLIKQKSAKSRAPYFKVAHGTDQFRYAELKATVLGSMLGEARIGKNNRGYSKHLSDAKLLHVSSKSDPRLNEFYDSTHGGREITDFWIGKLTAPAFAMWYCDDGSLCGKGISICVSRFGHEGCDKLVDWLVSMGRPAYKTVRDDGHIYLHVNNNDGKHLKNDTQMLAFWEWFANFIPEEMSYKAHKLFRDKCSNSWWLAQEEYPKSWSDEVVEIGPLFLDEKASRYSGYSKKGKLSRRQYCLTVEGDGNFITENLAVSNCKFDYTSTKIGTGLLLNNVFDTMLAYRLLTSGLEEDGKGGYVPAGFRDKGKKRFPYKSLNFLTQKFLGISLDKAVRESFVDQQYDKEFTEEQLKYAANDIVVLHPLCDILSQELANEDLIDAALLEFEFLRPCSEMEMNGVFINKDKWRGIITETRRQAESYEKLIAKELEPLAEQNTLFGASIVNVKSPDQILRAFKRLGFELEDTNEKSIKKVKHPLAKLLLDFRAFEKLASTYGEPILKKINSHTNRLHFTLHQLGADTGRLSSENPNIQNIPKDKDDPDAEVAISFRDCFEAEPGNVILTADYSQCELRILAEVSQDPKFLEIFRNNQDLHIITSQQVFGLSDAEIEIYLKVKKKDKPDHNLEDFFTPGEIVIYKKVADARDKTKTINFGIVYGLSAFSLTERFKISIEEAEGILNSYFKTYSGIKRWLDYNSKETVANRYARSLSGRKKYFTLADPSDEENFRRSKSATRRMGNNHVIQGTNADITKKALVDLQNAYDTVPGAKLLFTVHDEIVSECPESIAQEVAALKAAVMCQAFHVYVKTVPVGPDDKVSVSIAKHWSK